MDSIVLVAIDNVFSGYVVIVDELKENAKQTIANLQKVASELNSKNAKGGFLPKDKLNEVEVLKQNPENKATFIGDCINNVLVLAASDVGPWVG